MPPFSSSLVSRMNACATPFILTYFLVRPKPKFFLLRSSQRDAGGMGVRRHPAKNTPGDRWMG
jgi:hypothetical protein